MPPRSPPLWPAPPQTFVRTSALRSTAVSPSHGSTTPTSTPPRPPPAEDLCANLSPQAHGGIAITWEHDAHLYIRRAATLLHFLDPDKAARDLTHLTRNGVKRAKAIELPPEAESIRDEVRSF